MLAKFIAKGCLGRNLQTRAPLLSCMNQRFYRKAEGKKQTSNKVIDFRSDTVTRPTPLMKEAMLKCAVGDDVYGDDPTVNYMQKSVAEFFGKEAALYVTSGSQSNLVAMLTHCKNKGDSAIMGDKCHIY